LRPEAAAPTERPAGGHARGDFAVEISPAPPAPGNGIIKSYPLCDKNDNFFHISLIFFEKFKHHHYIINKNTILPATSF
jgi:hypothetical protein